MLGKMKVALAATAVAGALALGASGANAAEFDVGSLSQPTGASGSMAMDATAGASRLVITGSSPVRFECDTTYAEGSVDTGPYTRFGSPPSATIGRVLLKFEDCTGPSDFEFEITCMHPPSSATMLNVTLFDTNGASGSITEINCTIYFPLVDCSADLTGSTSWQYVNPTISTAAVLRILTTNQAMHAANSDCPSVIPNGPVDFGAPGPGPLDVVDLDYTVTGSLGGQPLVSPTY